MKVTKAKFIKNSDKIKEAQAINKEIKSNDKRLKNERVLHTTN